MQKQIMDDVKNAMRAKEAVKLSTLRMLQSAIKNKEIEVRPNELSDKDVISVVKKLVKQRKEAAEQYENAGRPELAEKEIEESKFLEVYLPAQMGEEQVTSIVEEVIAALGASSMKEMGAVMKEVQAKTAGSADGKMISSIVKAKLS
ncbi:MAG: GatB/YqeY domain-containing protein [Bdellovibrionota bacterium]|tara:strand:- start:62682 stop:63122 length:441 start_codon:yes stop_codon:yes gene_type:complete